MTLVACGRSPAEILVSNPNGMGGCKFQHRKQRVSSPVASGVAVRALHEISPVSFHSLLFTNSLTASLSY